MLALLLACETRELGLASEIAIAPSRWSPEDSASPEAWAEAGGGTCGAASAADPADGEDLLSPAWCVRISPEPIEEARPELDSGLGTSTPSTTSS